MRFRSFVYVGLVVLASCVDSKDYDLDTVNLTPTVAFPLASGEMGLLDLVSDKDATYLKVYPDGLLYFSYPTTFECKTIHDLFTLNTNNSTHTYDLVPGSVPPSASDVVLGTLNRQIDMNMSPAQLTEILLKAGTLSYNISLTAPTTPVPLPVDVVVTMTDVVDKTTLAPLTFTASLGSGTKPLQNYIIRMISNKFNIKLDFIVRAHANSIFIPSNDKVSVQFSFGGMDFSYIKGFLGDQTASIVQQTIPITVFSSSLNKSSVSILQPVVNFSIDNFYGVPGEVNLTKLQAEKSGSILPFVISPTSPFPITPAATMGSSSNTSLNVSNASALISFSPTEMVYAGSVRINKGLSSGNNFLTDAPLNITLNAEIPLYGRASGIQMLDTLKIDLGSIDASSVATATMKIKAVNELPIDATMQFYLANSNYTILDSLLTPNQSGNFVKGSTVTGGGELQVAGVTDKYLDLNLDKINKLFSTSYLIIRSRLNTSKDSNGALLNVKFKSTYKLKLNVGLSAKLNLSAK